MQPGQGSTDRERLTSRALMKFTGVVALAAIFMDASVGHGLLWENDPYWTYWITKTFLIATVFGLGTAVLGVGAGRGAVITAVHTIVLTVYYWTLSPIGLPSSPEWLDLEHTWITGVPVHFGVIYLGYLLALWIFQVRAAPGDGARLARDSLLASVAIVVIAGGVSSLALGEFPGFTWFLVRLLITVPLLAGWWAAVGRTPATALVGGSLLALTWATYGHYLAPNGLPDLTLRIFDAAPPSANVVWASYRDVWLISLPIYALVMGLVLWLLSRREDRETSVAPGAAFSLPLVLLLAVGVWNPRWVQPARGSVLSTGAPRLEAGPWYSDALVDAPGSLEMSFTDQGARVTPLPPHDRIRIRAEVTTSAGKFKIRADKPMVSHPEGLHTTWWGVGIHVDHHGRSGIGTNRLPNIDSEVAVFAMGDIELDGRTIAVGVPVHVMTADSGLPEDAHLELDVGRPGSEIPGVPHGHLRVIWDDYEGGPPESGHAARYAIGGLVLLIMLGGALSMTRMADQGSVA